MPVTVGFVPRQRHSSQAGPRGERFPTIGRSTGKATTFGARREGRATAQALASAMRSLPPGVLGYRRRASTSAHTMTVPSHPTTIADAVPAAHPPDPRGSPAAAPPLIDPDHEERQVAEHLFQTVVKTTPRMMLIGLAAAFLLVLVATWQVPASATDAPPGPAQRLAWAWFALLALALGYGGYLSRSHRPPYDLSLASPRARHFTWGSHVCAVIWGACSWVLLPASTPWGRTVILVGMCMVMLGSAASLAGYRRAMTWHVSLMAVTFAAGLLRVMQPESVAFGIGFLLLGVTAFSTAQRQQLALREAISGQLRIAALLDQLQGEKQQSEVARLKAVAAHEEAERAQAAKTVFMAAASHDLRQPMHALAQYVAAISRLNADPKLRASIEGANHALDAMAELLKAVLDISKLMSGAVTVRSDIFVLDDWAARQAAQLRPMAAAKGLALETFIQPQLLVCTDRVLLDRMVRNLLHNAITYTEEGRVTLSITRRDDHVRIRIADTGVGLTRRDRVRVFEPFFQVANPGRHREHGFGLGLAIVQELSDLLSIPVRLTSRVGRGCIFTLTLPLSPDRRRLSRAASPLRDTSAANRVSDALIVLIDDDDMSLRATEATLVAFGCQVVSGHDADEVLGALAGMSDCPQLIVADYRLCGTTGLEAVARVQQHCASAFGPQARPHALFVSGETDPEELSKVHAAGAQMLHKPVRPAVLFKHLNAALHRRLVRAEPPVPGLLDDGLP